MAKRASSATTPEPNDKEVTSATLDSETVAQASAALLRHLKVSGAPESSAAKEDENSADVIETISVVFTLKCPPKRASLKPKAVPLVHPLYNPDEDDVCFFVKDPQRLVKDHLAEHNVKGISKVLGVSKLQKRYGTHEGRRELCQLYDLFLVDDRIMPMMPRLLGNAFVQSKRLPLIIRMSEDIPKAISKALQSTAFCLSSGTTCSVRVAKSTFTAHQIVDNVNAAVSKIASYFPNNLSAFQAVYIKSETSPSLPIFFCLPSASDFARSPKEKAGIIAAIRKKKTKLAKQLKFRKSKGDKRMK